MVERARIYQIGSAREWMKLLLGNTQPILIGLQEKIAALSLQLQSAAAADQPRGPGEDDQRHHRSRDWRLAQV